ncbi:hypothetical protein FA95DRAFT_1562570 [Auriscalpium vulgare]|uniref:Uncharacterized protein n=1 Tax=Auriscalpium vulgare TaxID=40419 RepID=A0ACB8RKF1_9AGAM|nr:hypothetical protein FA95DRAFT_1562570 [Auriscalpium vulgare]
MTGTQKNRSNDHCLLLFANRNLADEWWRAISSDTLYAGIERIAPQYYTYDARTNASIIDVISSQPPALSDRALAVPLRSDGSGAFGITPSKPTTDQISGNL